MNKYIWITIGITIFILTLAWKQAPNEPVTERPLDISDQELQDLISESQNNQATLDIPEGDPIVSESGNIKITSPQPNTLVQSPILVKGEANLFEGSFVMRLKDSNNNIITEKTGTTKATEVGEFGDIGELLLFSDISTDTGFLELYSISAFDGSEQHNISIPINFNK